MTFDGYYIYVIENKLDGKIYVGQTKDLKKRWRGHKNTADANEDNRHIYNAIRTYGKENFDFIPFEKHNTLEESNRAEIFWIWFLMAQNRDIGYNILPGGDCKEHTPETIEKIRQARLGTTHSPETIQQMSEDRKGEGNAMFGRNHTEETKQLQRELKLGKYDGENNPFFGKTHTPEVRQKISDALKGKNTGEDNPMFGKTHTPETRKKLSDANKGKLPPNTGKPLSDETKSLISAALKGKKRKPFTEETLRKMSEAAKNRKKKSDIKIE
jgi:group I intron endonuclease